MIFIEFLLSLSPGNSQTSKAEICITSTELLKLHDLQEAARKLLLEVSVPEWIVCRLRLASHLYGSIQFVLGSGSVAADKCQTVFRLQFGT